MLKLHRRKRDKQRGMALAVVLILMFLGSILLVPLLSFVTSGVKSGTVYAKKTDELYAADAGIEDARWQIKYDYLDTILTSPSYSPFDFTTDWSYALSDNINDKTTNVTIENVWIPKNIAVPAEPEARNVIDAEKLIVTSGNGSSSFS